MRRKRRPCEVKPLLIGWPRAGPTFTVMKTEVVTLEPPKLAHRVIGLKEVVLVEGCLRESPHVVEQGLKMNVVRGFPGGNAPRPEKKTMFVQRLPPRTNRWGRRERCRRSRRRRNDGRRRMGSGGRPKTRSRRRCRMGNLSAPHCDRERNERGR